MIDKKKVPILTRIVQRFAGSTMEGMVEERVKAEINKANVSDVVRFSPRAVAMPGGGIRKLQPLGVSFQTLRDFAEYYPVARACVEFRKSQITHLEWGITPMELTNETVLDDKNVTNSKKIKEFFRYPTGKKDSSFSNWLKQILEDLLVIDAVAIYRRRNRRDDIIGYLPIDGSTIELMLDHDGTTPEPPNDAYIQRIQGMEKARLTIKDLIYAIMTPRTHTAYGLAPLETLIITVTTALKLQSFNLAFLTEGNVPEGFVTLPRDIASSRDQLKEWQDAWDAMLSGDPRFQRKLKFLPEGMKYEPTIKAEDMTFERFEKWLLQNTCAVFGLHPSSIGFNFDINRATAQISWEAGRERGLFPTALFLKEMMDRIIQDDLKHPELEFVWTNIDPTNRREEAQVVQTLVNSGLMSIDEWRLGEGLKPTGVKDPFIMTPVGPIFVKDLVAQSEAGQTPILPYKPPIETPTPTETAPTKLPNVPPQAQSQPAPVKIEKENVVEVESEIIEELRKWKRTAINDLKEKRSFRKFNTDIIDSRTQELIGKGLEKTQDRDGLEKIFEPFLNKEYKTTTFLLDLYDKIYNIAADTESSSSQPYSTKIS